MSSNKALKSVKDENTDLQKQIGCITGFFQLFDRHRFITHRTPSSTSGESSNGIKELNTKNTMHKAKEKNLKVAREKQQFSTESSITSMSSSSCSSSMSSLEFNRTIQTESLSTGGINVSENLNSELPLKRLASSTQKSIDFYDIVKESMQRESHGLSVKTLPREQKKGPNHTLKYIDSPRPMPAPKSVNAGVVVSNEAFHNLAKSKKAPWDSPRLSYDGRDTQDRFKTSTKHKEFPRFSLDSKQGSIGGLNEGNKSRNLLKGPQKGHLRSSSSVLNQPQEPDSSRRSSSVVAKLMGLETLPDCTQTCQTPPGSASVYNNKNELLETTSAQYRMADSITNTTPYSRFALESSPWRQTGAGQVSQLHVSKGSESDVKASKSCVSVYGEIDKRRAELEFKKSGKDLRALKQILDAMQRYKDSSDSTSDQASNSPSYKNISSLNQGSKSQSPRIRQKDSEAVTIGTSNTSQGSALPIVIMKPAKVARKSNDPSSKGMRIRGNGRLIEKQTSKDISSTIRNLRDPFSQSEEKSNNLRTSKSMQSLKVPQASNGENTSSGNITAARSPRVQKKFGLERRSPPSSPSSDSSISRRQKYRNSLEFSSSPSTTPRPKFSTLHERNECFSETSVHWRDFKARVNFISPDFDNKRSSQREIIGIDQSGNTNSNSIHLGGLNQNCSGNSKADTVVTIEQPSPVSVLDPAFYGEDPPSPVRKRSDISDDSGEVPSADEYSEENSVDLPLSNATKANLITGDRDWNNQNFIQSLQDINQNDEKLTSYSDNKDFDHKYIAEILLASGLLSGRTSSQISHSPGHLINPKLFFALEQMKTNQKDFNSSKIISPEQLQRRLIFDVVNDILVQKAFLESSCTQWRLTNQLPGRNLQGKQLLHEVCTEISQLQPQKKSLDLAIEDENLTSLLWGDSNLMHHPTVWTNSSTDIPNVVLDIERLIFKDLITEVVRGELANSAGRHCRQLLFH
ncbi:longifolia [Stylosanthes scabra]|uniref:Longifolia n=1 Tax=Stylosanthes scabra TaxID=79078 RepID=A0ABU6UWQ8_9FABA|nr:longifolia [Stylosanthes scabra]